MSGKWWQRISTQKWAWPSMLTCSDQVGVGGGGVDIELDGSASTEKKAYCCMQYTLSRSQMCIWVPLKGKLKISHNVAGRISICVSMLTIFGQLTLTQEGRHKTDTDSTEYLKPILDHSHFKYMLKTKSKRRRRKKKLKYVQVSRIRPFLLWGNPHKSYTCMSGHYMYKLHLSKQNKKGSAKIHLHWFNYAIMIGKI